MGHIAHLIKFYITFNDIVLHKIRTLISVQFLFFINYILYCLKEGE